MNFNKKLIIPLVFGIVGLTNLIIVSIYDARMIHIGIVGILSIITSVGLFFRKNVLYRLGVALTIVHFTIGVSILFSSINFSSSSSTSTFLLNLGLVGYFILALILFTQLLRGHW